MFLQAMAPHFNKASRGRMVRALRRFALIGFVALVTGLFQVAHSASIDSFMLGNYKIGGDFTLTNQSGGRTSLQDLRGKVVLLSFGYTNCPDVCPTTMADFGKALRRLGAKAEAVRAVIITVDPERDTPQRLKSYLANFHDKLIGLTGSVEELTRVAKQYSSRFRAEEPGPNTGYSVGHTTFVFILDQTGKPRYVMPYDIGSKIIVEGVEALLGGKV